MSGVHFFAGRPARIGILTGQHLCHNPRVIKETLVLRDAGYEVVVIGAAINDGLKKRDEELAARLNIRFLTIGDLTGTGIPARARRLFYRMRHRVGHAMFYRFGWENAWQLGYFAPELRRYVLENQAELVILHSEAALASAPALLAAGRRLGIDMEDWFSEDLLPEARRSRPLALLRSLERLALRGAVHATCPSAAMSAALATEFGCAVPAVIYNAFPWVDRAEIGSGPGDRADRSIPSLHWYSQTLGPGRGLEDLVAALPRMKNTMQIHLRGKPAVGFADWLEQSMSPEWRARLHVHDLVPNHELLGRIAEHDIGFAGEMQYCRSRDLTVTNKILHYLLGGLAVLASRTAGQVEIATRAPEAIRLYPSGNPLALAEQLDLLLESGETLRRAREAALAAAQEIFCWERQVPVLLASVRAGLAPQK